jgi:2-iminobutanoate/2-iminopropanoate deaminase
MAPVSMADATGIVVPAQPAKPREQPGAQHMQTINPPDIVKPASNYAQGVLHSSGTRLVISGQVGLAPDGTLESGMAAQMERAWSNVFGILRAAGFDRRQLVKCAIYVTEPGQTALFREVRDRMLDGHLCATTYLQVAGLAAPGFLVEIEAEAVREG